MQQAASMQVCYSTAFPCIAHAAFAMMLQEWWDMAGSAVLVNMCGWEMGGEGMHEGGGGGGMQGGGRQRSVQQGKLDQKASGLNCLSCNVMCCHNSLHANRQIDKKHSMM